MFNQLMLLTLISAGADVSTMLEEYRVEYNKNDFHHRDIKAPMNLINNLRKNDIEVVRVLKEKSILANLVEDGKSIKKTDLENIHVDIFMLADIDTTNSARAMAWYAEHIVNAMNSEKLIKHSKDEISFMSHSFVSKAASMKNSNIITSTLEKFSDPNSKAISVAIRYEKGEIKLHDQMLNIISTGAVNPHVIDVLLSLLHEESDIINDSKLEQLAKKLLNDPYFIFMTHAVAGNKYIVRDSAAGILRKMGYVVRHGEGDNYYNYVIISEPKK